MVGENELRIGNIVKFPYNNTPQEVGDIERLEQDDGTYEYYISCKSDKFPRHTSTISPITLTSEILEKCRFTKSGDDVYRMEIMYADSNSPCIIYIHNYSKIEITRSGIGAISIQCKNLHQLQNVYFALTRTELIINQ